MSRGSFPQNPKTYQSGFISAVLAGVSLVSGVLGKKKEKKAGRIRQQAQRLQNERARLLSMRQFRQTRANILAGGVASGAELGSSGIQGVLGSTTTQQKGALEFAQQQSDLGEAVASNLEKASKFATLSSAFAAGANIATQVKELREDGGGGGSGSSSNVNSSPFRFFENPGVR